MGEKHSVVDGFLGVVSREIASFLLDNFEEFWKSKKERVRCRGGFRGTFELSKQSIQSSRFFQLKEEGYLEAKKEVPPGLSNLYLHVLASRALMDLVSLHGGIGSLFLDTVGHTFSQKYNQFGFGKRSPRLGCSSLQGINKGLKEVKDRADIKEKIKALKAELYNSKMPLCGRYPSDPKLVFLTNDDSQGVMRISGPIPKQFRVDSSSNSKSAACGGWT
ncbi:hypothetical protein PVL29_005234 [Vitis rotundifolia]|uniref:Uncharacterized protein n=1 Tax=Vitis rotundifolia TaxID=103349 RepID=A0AA39E0S3_VITRO|nr:hypothetical protein PVL29_005234 [Vitis rotundifolia]